jgi:hypothetical protein
MAIEFDFNPLLRELNTLEKVKLPTAARRSLYETGRYLREFHRREMQSEFRDPVPFTLASPRYRVDPQNLTLTMSISMTASRDKHPPIIWRRYFARRARIAEPCSQRDSPNSSPVLATCAPVRTLWANRVQRLLKAAVGASRSGDVCSRHWPESKARICTRARDRNWALIRGGL